MSPVTNSKGWSNTSERHQGGEGALKRDLTMTTLAGAVALLLCFTAHAAQYTAFSLKVAQQRIEKAGEGWRQKEPEVVSLGDINKVEGFVYDEKTGDPILVGDHEEGRAALTLDDLVVALRARFRDNEWSSLSTESGRGDEVVRRTLAFPWFYCRLTNWR